MLKLLKSDSAHAVIDTREPEEWNLGHIVGSINIPLQSLKHTIFSLVPNKDAPIVILFTYQPHHIQDLEKMGYKQVSFLDLSWELYGYQEFCQMVNTAVLENS